VIRRALLDTGPLVALLNRRDRHHDWACEEWSDIEPPLLSCDAVISEACFLLRSVRGGSTSVLELVDREVVALPFRLDHEAARVKALLLRYANVPMSLADACLVRMAEQYPSSPVLTLDRDFRLYRKNGRQVIPARMPREE
jgi:predicted nucleic acid-binding protein